MYALRRRSTAVALLLSGVLLTACGPGEDDSSTSGTSAGESANASAGDDGADVDAGVLDTDSEVLNEDLGEATGGSCDLADASDVFTPAFAEAYGEYSEEIRCQIPGDGDIIDLFRERGYHIDGMAQVAQPGEEDHSLFYLAFDGPCGNGAEVAYFPAEDNYSPNKTNYPEKLRFATPVESLDSEESECP